MASGHCCHPQPWAALGWDGIPPWLSTAHQGACCLCPRGLAVLLGSISPSSLSPLSLPFVPHPSTALPLHLGSFGAVWALWSIPKNEDLLTPPLLKVLNEPGRCWDSQTRVKALLGLSKQGWVLAGQKGLHPPFAPCSLQDLAQHQALGLPLPQPSLGFPCELWGLAWIHTCSCRSVCSGCCCSIFQGNIELVKAARPGIAGSRFLSVPICVCECWERVCQRLGAFQGLRKEQIYFLLC